MINLLYLLTFIISVSYITFFIKVILNQRKAIKELNASMCDRDVAWNEYVKFRDLYFKSISEKHSDSHVHFYYRCALKCWGDYEKATKDAFKKVGIK